VAALTARVRASDPDAAGFVHWGATSQDIVDTTMVLLIERASAILAEDHRRLATGLRELSDRHAGDVMVGRTLLQAAPPVTFGLKAAGWYASVVRSWARLDRARRDATVLQFGGASGTLAALEDKGLAVAERLATELGLPCPAGPWHTSRDRLAAYVTACAIYAGALGKMARDISLLMQPEIAEAAEPGGSSSTLPHKQNPVGCTIALAAAARLAGLAATVLASMVQEHERAVGGWHAEWPVITDAIQATGAAVAAMRDVIGALAVNPAAMRNNLERLGDAVVAERVMMRAARALGRDQAHGLVRDAFATARANGETLAQVAARDPRLAAALSASDLQAFEDAAGYLGAAETLRARLLASAGED
jgi:3-carboxy-cis,cis-muconate cycloisomerase